MYLRQAIIFKEQVIVGSSLGCGFNRREEQIHWLFKRVAEMRKGSAGFQRREVGMMIGLFCLFVCLFS